MRKLTRVRPVMAAAELAREAYADTHILFDWHLCAGWKGDNIDNIKVKLRGTNGAAQGGVGIDLFFATGHIKEDVRGAHIYKVPPTLGTTGAAVSAPGWQNNLIGYVPIVAGDFNDNDLIYLNIANKDLSGMEIPVDGQLYVAAIAKGSIDFRSTVVVGETADPRTETTITVGTTSATINFAVGDVIHDEDGEIYGTIESLTATTITFTDPVPGTVTSGKDLYNISPIELILSGGMGGR